MYNKITDSSSAVIIGAGPVGCLMACFLMKAGVKDVTLYEKRRDPRVWPDSGKSINLALSTRGLTALRFLDERIEESLPCLKSAIPMRGRQIWSKNETMYQPYSENPSVEYLNSINRAHLNNDLINLAISEGARVVFEHPVQGVDFENRVVVLMDEKNKKSVAVPYKTLWGVDGSNSRVRAEIERIHGLPKDTGVVKFKAGYKEFEILPDKNGKPQLHPMDAFHVWPRDGGNFFIALPNADNTYTCTMFTTIDDPEYLGNLNEQTIVKLFEKEFPDVFAIMGKEKIVSDFKVNPLSGLYFVDAKHWHYKGEVVIMGDAAHGTVPYYGLGINGGFEGCRHMFNIISKYTKNGVPDWNSIFTEFNGFKVHSDILRILSVRNADELHSKVKSNEFLFEKEVERCLQSKYPNKFVEDHALLSFTNVPLETCMRQFEKQQEIVKTLVKGKHNIKQIDWELADRLVKSNSLLENWTLWYEKSKL